MAERSSPGKKANAQDVLGPLEAAVMRVLWSRPEASVSSVLGEVNAGRERALAYTTVMTVLVRLHDKGLAQRRRQGRQYVYRAALDEPALIEASSRAAIAALVERYGTTALRQFAERLYDLDPELKARLQKLAGTPPSPREG